MNDKTRLITHTHAHTRTHARTPKHPPPTHIGKTCLRNTANDCDIFFLEGSATHDEDEVCGDLRAQLPALTPPLPSFVHCGCTSTETVRTIRDQGAQDGHFVFYIAPELLSPSVCILGYFKRPLVTDTHTHTSRSPSVCQAAL